LRVSAPARIVNVSSVAHTRGAIDFTDLQGARRYAFPKAYGQSKLAQVLFTYALADRLQGTGVTVNALHPGVVTSNFNNGMRGLPRVVGAAIYAVIGISAEKGARTSLYLATSPEVARVSGKYFVNCKETRSSHSSYDMALQQWLWQVSEELTQQSVQLPS
jgi:NAD(P)-dependent dehydrogenase (short-subunit alcohol dehydrogenase family)